MESIGTNFNHISIKTQIFLIKKMHLKIMSAKWQQFCSMFRLYFEKQFEQSVHQDLHCAA